MHNKYENSTISSYFQFLHMDKKDGTGVFYAGWGLEAYTSTYKFKVQSLSIHHKRVAIHMPSVTECDNYHNTKMKPIFFC